MLNKVTPLLALALGTFACAPLAPPATAVTTPFTTGKARATVDGQPLELYLARPAGASRAGPLVIYASGDGGWFGAAIGMFKTIAAAGYPEVGLSTRALLGIERRQHGGPLAATHLARAFEQIADQGTASLGLPAGPVVLTGWSRGAALAMLTAAEGRPTAIIGAIGIGLAADEDLDVDLDSDDDPEEGRPGEHVRNMYAVTQEIAVPCAVVQATGDAYLPAAEGRVLFGPDTATRRFYTVPADNHRFGGGAERFRAALTDALAWIADRNREGR